MAPRIACHVTARAANARGRTLNVVLYNQKGRQSTLTRRVPLGEDSGQVTLHCDILTAEDLLFIVRDVREFRHDPVSEQCM